MENASKALIIAGAILLAILIIALGMFIYKQSSSAAGKVNIDAQAVAAYNGEFEAYEGTQSGSNARALCDLIRAHNNANVDDASLNIVISDTDQSATTAAPTALVTASAANSLKESIKAGNTYKVTFGYDAKSGYIVACGITKIQ